ncbi:MAG TPA: TlpA disulfide reductase family protein [Polyangiaceae bacterium]|jgi:peroxiredoxin
MRARRRAWVGVALAAAFSASCAETTTGGASASAPLAPSGTHASDFAARDVQGRTVRLSDHLARREVVLIDFWSTFCEPCLAEMPHLEALYEAERAKGFVILAVSMDGPETVADVPGFARRHGLSFPVVLDEDSHVASIYNPKKSAPFSVLIDRQGTLVRAREGYNPGDEQLVAEDVRAALASTPPSRAPAR